MQNGHDQDPSCIHYNIDGIEYYHKVTKVFRQHPDFPEGEHSHNNGNVGWVALTVSPQTKVDIPDGTKVYVCWPKQGDSSEFDKWHAAQGDHWSSKPMGGWYGDTTDANTPVGSTGGGGSDNNVIRDEMSSNSIYSTLSLSLGTPKNNTWEHYAIVREGDTFRTFKNGKIIDEVTGAIPVLRYDEDRGDYLIPSGDGERFNIKSPTNNPILSIAGDTKFINSNWYLNGHLDELRISKGHARYEEEFSMEGDVIQGAVEATIPVLQPTSCITYCPDNKMLYAFTANNGLVYRIDPMSDTIMSGSSFSDSDVERVTDSYYCPINNTILVSSYDGLYKLHSFLPKAQKVNKVFNVWPEVSTGGKMTFAATVNKMYFSDKNYIYEIEA